METSVFELRSTAYTMRIGRGHLDICILPSLVWWEQLPVACLVVCCCTGGEWMKGQLGFWPLVTTRFHWTTCCSCSCTHLHNGLIVVTVLFGVVSCKVNSASHPDGRGRKRVLPYPAVFHTATGLLLPCLVSLLVCRVLLHGLACLLHASRQCQFMGIVLFLFFFFFFFYGFAVFPSVCIVLVVGRRLW